MKTLLRRVAVPIGLALIAFTAPGQTTQTFQAVVTVAPLQGLVKPLLPEGGELTTLMQPGRSEHGYEFTPGDLAKLAGADLVVYVGLGLEPKIAEWLAEHPDPSRRVVEFAQAVGIAADQSTHETAHQGSEIHGHADHVHDATCNHDHSGPDQHLWLDPVLVKQLIPAVQAAIQHALADRNAPDSVRNSVNAAAADLVTRIEAVDEEWRLSLAPLKGVSIVTHHNAFGRPAARYGFSVAEAIRTSEGAEPSPADLARIVASIKENRVKAIFVEPQFSPKVANRIAKAAKVKVATLDPLGDGDWFALMDANRKSIVENAK